MTRSEQRARCALWCERRRAGRWLAATIVPMLIFASSVHAQQSLAQRVAAVEGEAELRFASRPDVCGNGEGNISLHSSTMMRSTTFGGRHGWSDMCEPGPVRVRISVSDGSVTRVRTYVGGRHDSTPDVADLGVVGVREAVDYFLGLAREAPARVGRRAILPAALADSTVIVPPLIALARDRSRPTEIRKRSLFWAGQVGELDVLEPASAIANDSSEGESIRSHAIFVLSQLPDSAGIPALMDVVRHGQGMQVRKEALFWLGQKDDPRVVEIGRAHV